MSRVHRDQRSSSATVATAALLALVMTGVACVAQAVPVDLLVASHNTNSVKRYDGATGAYLDDFVTAVANPRGMSFGPDGNLYVAGGSYSVPGSGSIRRFDGTTGADLGPLTSGHPGAIGFLIFGPDGDLYGAVLLHDYVIRVDPSTGTWLPIGAGSPLQRATGVAFGADGNLYVGNYLDNHVLRFDGTDGHYLGVFATVPIAGTAGHVADVTFGPDGDLLVNIGYEEPTGKIWRFDGTTGASKGAFIPEADRHPAMNHYQSFGPDGNLYVVSGTTEVLRYDGTTGAYIDSFVSGGGLDGPYGLAFVPEPGTATQLGAGLALLGALARRRYRGDRHRPGAHRSLSDRGAARPHGLRGLRCDPDGARLRLRAGVRAPAAAVALPEAGQVEDLGEGGAIQRDEGPLGAGAGFEVGAVPAAPREPEKDSSDRDLPRSGRYTHSSRRVHPVRRPLSLG